MGETDLRRTFGWAIVAGLCLAAAVAVVALLIGEFGDVEVRIIATSIGFSVFTAIGAPGVTAAQREGTLRRLGLVAAATAGVAYAILLVALWTGDDGNDLWQPWGVATVVALGLSHASLVLVGRRPSDTSAIRTITGTSIVLGAVDTAVGALTISEVFADVDESLVRVFGVTVVLLLLTTALPPIMRRLSRAGADTQPDLADELEAVAARLETLDAPREVASEAATLRRLAAKVRRH